MHNRQVGSRHHLPQFINSMICLAITISASPESNVMTSKLTTIGIEIKSTTKQAPVSKAEKSQHIAAQQKVVQLLTHKSEFWTQPEEGL